jgi:carbon-monoxide dehydrogenase small subunit
VTQPIPIEPPVRQRRHATFIVNGERHEVAVAPHRTLLELLREDLALTGTKHGCELGECGTCTVLVDGVPILSCLALAVAYENRPIETVEGMAHGNTLHPLQEAFADLGAAQCGYCTPGFLLAAKALLDTNPHPSRAEIVEALSGNLCRCTGYLKIFEAVEMVRDAGCGMRDAEECGKREAGSGKRETLGSDSTARAESKGAQP